jgi:hypothetical protein
MVLGRLSNGVIFKALISKWTCHYQCYLLAIFIQKNKLDGGLPKKDLGPHFRVGIKAKKSWGQ